MKINKLLYIVSISCLMAIHVHAQEVTQIGEDVIIEQQDLGIPGVNLVQFGNQNVAELIQLQSFSSQISLQQDGNFNSALLVQYGSGIVRASQNGDYNRIASLLFGENMDVEMYQEGQENVVRQLSIGNNSTYQFIQLGTDNTINHLNFRGNDTGLFIQQRGHDMHISVYTH